MTEVQATVREHDAGSGAGSLLTDDGRALDYDGDAFRAGGLRLLRSGQRVRARLEAGPTGEGERVVGVTLVTFEL